MEKMRAVGRGTPCWEKEWGIYACSHPTVADYAKECPAIGVSAREQGFSEQSRCKCSEKLVTWGDAPDSRSGAGTHHDYIHVACRNEAGEWYEWTLWL